MVLVTYFIAIGMVVHLGAVFGRKWNERHTAADQKTTAVSRSSSAIGCPPRCWPSWWRKPSLQTSWNVLRALTAAGGMTWDQLDAVAMEKCMQRGGSDSCLFLGSVQLAG